MRLATLPLIVALCAIADRPSAAQGAPSAPSAAAMECLREHGSYRPCALAAFDLRPLEEVRLPPGDREIRLWIETGIFLPERLVVVQTRRGRASGAAHLWWPVMEPADTGFARFIRGQCGELRSAPGGGMCLLPREPAIDWADLMRRLDSLHVTELPDQRELPRDGIYTDDGFRLSVEVRNGGAYRAYAYGNPHTHADPSNQRAAAIHRLAIEVLRAGR